MYSLQARGIVDAVESLISGSLGEPASIEQQKKLFGQVDDTTNTPRQWAEMSWNNKI